MCLLFKVDSTNPEEIIYEHPWINISQSWIWLSMGKLENIEECWNEQKPAFEAIQSGDKRN